MEKCRVIIIIILFFLCVYSCSNKYKEYYSSGEIKILGNVENERLEGKLKVFYKNGQLWRLFKFEEGELSGKNVIYYEDGTIKSIINFQNGKLHGEYEHYRRNGGKDLKAYFHSGKLKCCVEKYYSNNQMKSKILFSNIHLEYPEVQYSSSKKKILSNLNYDLSQELLHKIKHDSPVFKQEFSKGGTFQNEFREVKVYNNTDTIGLEDSFGFTVKVFGPIEGYEETIMGVTSHNLIAKYNDKKEFKNGSLKIDDVMFGNYPGNEQRYYFKVSNRKNDVSSLWVPDSTGIIDKKSKNNRLSFIYKPKKPGNHLLGGCCRLIPYDSLVIKEPQEYPFSVKFYVKK